MKMRVPLKENHPVVGDNLTGYYHFPLLRRFFLSRLTQALDLLEEKHFDSILEIGFGSGILLPELSHRCNHLFGLDLHGFIPKVNDMLTLEKVKATLLKGDVVYLPYKNESFDCVISVATLEHVKELSRALSGIKRILRKRGVIVLGFPVTNKLSNWLLVKAGSVQVYKKTLKEIHPSSHNDILDEVRKQFVDIKVKQIPNFLPMTFSLYCVCRAYKID